MLRMSLCVLLPLDWCLIFFLSLNCLSSLVIVTAHNGPAPLLAHRRPVHEFLRACKIDAVCRRRPASRRSQRRLMAQYYLYI